MTPELLREHGVKLYALCSYGRSGTSFLMGLLSALNVGVAGFLPYEERASQTLFVQWLRKELQMADAESVGAGPEFSEHFSGMSYSSTIFDDARRLADRKAIYVDWIRSFPMARAHGIAEKFVGLDLLRVMRAFDGTGTIKPIYLLRDPRDIFISIKNFNAKRGFSSFNDCGDNSLLLDTICNYEEGQVALFKRLGGLLCYYEDLVVYQDRALVQLASYVGHGTVTTWQLDAVKADLEKRADGARDHMTSPDPRNSVQRWRTSAEFAHASLFESRATTISGLGYKF